MNYITENIHKISKSQCFAGNIIETKKYLVTILFSRTYHYFAYRGLVLFPAPVMLLIYGGVY